MFHMSSQDEALKQSSVPTAKDWGVILREYATPSNGRAAIEVAITFGPFFALWAITSALLHYGHWWALALIIPMGLLLLRLFTIQHDCGHGAFFKSKQANDWIGRIISVFTLTPYSFWRHTHNMHHAGAGNLDHRGFGDVDTLTVEEYKALSKFQQLKYRVYRHPIVLFGLGPSYIFFIDQRLPFGQMKRGWMPWASTLGTNVYIAIVYALMMWLVGWKLFLIIQLPVVVIAATVGVWLFYVQHQFEETVWHEAKDWQRADAALHGSSHYDLPQPLRWFTANIGLHHIHHLSARIPFYKLGQIVRRYPELGDINRMTILESFKCVPLALWDEQRRKMISFRDMRATA